MLSIFPMYLLAIHKSSWKTVCSDPLPIFKSSLCKHLSFWQQQSCQPVGLPLSRGHSFSSKGLYPRVLMLGTMCLFAAGRIKPYPQHSGSPCTLAICGVIFHVPVTVPVLIFRFLQLDHLLRPLCLEHPGTQEISQ